MSETLVIDEASYKQRMISMLYIYIIYTLDSSTIIVNYSSSVKMRWTLKVLRVQIHHWFPTNDKNILKNNRSFDLRFDLWTNMIRWYNEDQDWFESVQVCKHEGFGWKCEILYVNKGYQGIFLDFVKKLERSWNKSSANLYFRPKNKIIFVVFFLLSAGDRILPFNLPSKRGWLHKIQFASQSKPIAMYQRSAENIPNGFDARLSLFNRTETFFKTWKYERQQR